MWQRGRARVAPRLGVLGDPSSQRGTLVLPRFSPRPQVQRKPGPKGSRLREPGKSTVKNPKLEGIGQRHLHSSSQNGVMIQRSRNHSYRNAIKLYHLYTFVTLFMWLSSDYVPTAIRRVVTSKTT